MQLYLIIINTVLLLIVGGLLVLIVRGKKTESIPVEKKVVSDNYTQFIQLLPFPVIKINEEGLITDFNRVAKELIPNIELGKLSQADLIISAYEPLLPYKEAFKSRKTIVKKFVLSDKQYQMSIIPFFNNSNISGFYEIFHDITKLEKLKKSNAQRSKLETLGHLSMGMAHDFNNILQVIIGNAELCIDSGAVSKEIVDNMEVILKAGSRASDMTRHLLIFSRDKEIEFANFDINDLINNLQKILSRLIPENIQIELKLLYKKLVFKGDKVQFEQILINLCVNAKDAMPEGGVIKISTEEIEIAQGDFDSNPERVAGQYIKISVADTGTGISKEHIDKIFEPFFTTKGAGKGTGLGLSNVNGIVKQFGGFIDIESNIGFGTIFKIYLPLFNKAETNGLEITTKKPVTLSGKQETILVIEDDNLICKVMTSMLKKRNFKVIVCKDVDSATEEIINRRAELNLIISDLILPDGNGYALYNSLRNLHIAIPFIVVSGYTKEKEELKALIDEGVPFLKKPFSASELLDTVFKVLYKDNTES